LRARVKERKEAKKTVQTKIPRLEAGERVLSWSQQRLWLLDQLMGASPVYNISFAIRLAGELEVAILIGCLETITARHEALRTRFLAAQGTARIVIDAPASLQVGVEEARTIEEVLAIWRTERAHCFDIGKESLFRVRLLRETPDSHVLVVTIHHIVSDAWSLGVFFKELVSSYNDVNLGRPVALTDLPIQFSDYAAWQRRWLSEAVLQEQLRYWERQLADLPPLLMLPTDRPRPLEQTFKGATEAVHIPADLTAALHQLGKSHGATPFMILLSVFSILLGRYAGQEDVVVGAPVANRTRRETEDLIGFFVNTLVMRTDLTGNPSFSELLRRVRETALQAYAHQDLPFEYLVEALNPERSLSHTPLFQVMFILQNAPMDGVALQGVKVTPLDGTQMDGFSRFDLTLSLAEGQEGFKGVFEYNTTLFDRSTIRRLADHYIRLLRFVVAAPGRDIGSLDPLSDRERQQQLDWNDTRVAYDLPCVHEAVAAQVQRTPDVPAVLEEGTRVSYRELDTRAGALAVMLRREGLQVGDRVGICMGRSIDMVVAMLAVLKAGGAYVPIDPDYPRARIEYIVSQGGVSRVLTQRPVHERLTQSEGPLTGPVWWRIDEIGLDRVDPREMLALLPHDLTADHPMYVIFTSGSTGSPKGVVGRHGSVMNRLLWLNDRYPVQSDEVFCQKTSIGFVDHVAEIFQALTTGTPLVIFPSRNQHSPSQMLEGLRTYNITRLTVVPSLLHALLAEQGAAACPALRLLITSGEALVVKDREAFGRRFPHARLLNLYGSTEVGADVTSYEVNPQDEGAVPIGRAIANTGAYVLSRDGRLLPRGGIGELFIGGEGLAQGYLGQPGLTAERFVPDPFGQELGARLYRTGDLVRFRENGVLEYIGRADHQVKIRGFRIDLGEIDVALRAHSMVENAVTTVHVTATGADQLVVYVVAKANAQGQASATVIQDHLKARLPNYMVPTAYVFLDRLPLNASGKIDRRALAAPAPITQSHEEPMGECEVLLAMLWREVLQCRPVGRHDNFFELGGHSLLVTQLVARVRNHFGVEIPLLSVFEHQTLRAQAQLIASLKAGQTATDPQALTAIPILNAVERSVARPLSFAQQRLWFLNELLGPNPSYNIPLALSLEGDLDVSVLERSVNDLIERHESLRTSFLEHDGQARQLVKPTGKISLKLESLPNHQALERAVQEERLHCFDLCTDGLLRVRLLREHSPGGAHRHVLLVTVHHIVADGWSLGVFFRELVASYRAYQMGESPGLPPVEIQYLDYAAWQQSWLDSGVLETQLAYWRERLADLPPMLELPSDRPRPPQQSFRGSGVSFTCSADLLERLKALSRRQGVTLFMTLLSAYAVLLRRYTGQDDIVVGTPVANRMRRESENTIGFFANTLVMRTDLSGNPSFVELLERTRDSALGAYAHQDIPFERLVDALNPARTLSYSPLFQVMFVLQNAPLDVQKIAGLAVETLQLEEREGIARFDLHLAMGETRGLLAGRVEYNSDIFDRARIQRFVAHLETVLEAIAKSPQTAVGHFDYLTNEERQRQLVAYNDTAVDYSREVTLKTLFEAQVERTPAALAVECSGTTLSYAQLNARANRLAHYLLAQGVRPDDCIGLCLERSVDLVVGIYAVLKAGCAYVPLDPEYPRDRLAYMVEEARVKCVVTHKGLAGAAGLIDSIVELGSDALCAELERCSDHDPRLPELTSRHLAYVIYTSGSTGQPKGVMLEHQAVVNRILWMQNQYGLQATDVVLQKTPFSFDVSVWEFVWPLVIGAKLVVAAPNGHKDPDYLIELIRESAVTTLHFVPSMLQGVLSLGRWQSCDSVRRVFCSGEALSRELVRAFFASGTQSELHNLYGPTEAAIDVSYWQCSDSPEAATVPIGKPIQNIQLHIVDDNMKLVPEATAGELLIAGDGLARGYIGRPDLTEEKFITAHFPDSAPVRVYRTGDLVRRLPGGDIEYLGRIDNQVKINGFRIELGEIESQLDGYPSIRKSVVVAHRDGASTQLVAYLVLSSPEQDIATDRIREHLAARLPAFMIPQIFVPLDSVPLSPNGKLDKRRLPPFTPQQLRRSEFEPPGTELEKQLAQVWQHNLRLTQIGVTDNYFALGGDSIRSIALVAHARAMGVEFRVKDLFMHPTIAGLAAAIAQGNLDRSLMQMPEAFDLISADEKRALFEQFSFK
jgi:amino acid adenylation domain-containing protein